MTKEIHLTQGKVALVDDSDFEMLNQYKWHAYCNKWNSYGARHVRREDGGRITVYLHRQILDAPHGIEVDHINYNGLDNRRENLRLCSRPENGRNTRIRTNNTSGYKGVYWSQRGRKWCANIRIGGVTKHLGSFSTIEQAAAAYDAASTEHFGDFAHLNFGGEG